jgi:AraC family transcriptional regulator of adaptative response / DNA-3-methyladenine glycosylase II
VLDADACYRALLARDARFDGRFFTGVVTTGVYCRPVCPARTPKRENVRFFALAAAAEDAGFRPCKRCRPETAAGSLAWLGSSRTVSRALDRIADGALDGDGVDALAARLGVGARQLRRLFAAHLGAPPRAVAQTRRAHFARQLVDETPLPITEIALAAGFSSIRRFNTAFRETFGTSPRDVRRGSGARPGPGAASIELRLAFRPPLDWPALLAFLERRSIAAVEEVAGGAYRRTFEIDGVRGAVEVAPLPGEHALALRAPTAAARALLPVVRRARRLFDLDCDPREIRHGLGRDALLARALGARDGLRVPGAWDGFEIAVRAVLGQQISVAGARTLAGRIAERYGEPLDGGGGLRRLFPRPEALVSANLARVGMPETRAETIRALARAITGGRLDLEAGAVDPDATRARLEAIPGIGPWTAQYVAMRALQDPDAFLAGDLGVRRALARGGTLPGEREVLRRAEAWRPWRAYAVMALWCADPPEGKGRRTHGARARVARNTDRNPRAARRPRGRASPGASG